MGRKKNLQALHNRRVYLKNKVAGMSDTDMAKDVFEDELEALEWALRKLEAEGEIGIGDRVRLAVVDDPDGEEGHQPEEGTVLGRTGSGDWLIRPMTGEYSGTLTGLWYSKDNVELLDK